MREGEIDRASSATSLQHLKLSHISPMAAASPMTRLRAPLGTPASIAEGNRTIRIESELYGPCIYKAGYIAIVVATR